MKNKINIAELLKVCPTGMELDSPVWNNIVFEEIDGDNIVILRKSIREKVYLTKYGEVNSIDGKCVIFPKGKTTWDGFVHPCKFRDGDVISNSLGTCIFKGEGELKGTVDFYCGTVDFVTLCVKDKKGKPLAHYGDIFDYRLATEEEKEKFFKTIKDNGYRWVPETKTLEKLVEPKFHEGQLITNGYVGGQITSVEDNYHCYKIADFMGGIKSIPFILQDNYHLWTIRDANDGDVLAAHECLVLFKTLDGLNIKCYCSYHLMNNRRFYVDTLQNKDAFHPATQEERQKLFDAVKANGYKWNAETKALEGLVEPKFKVGDKIVKKGGITLPVLITKVGDEFYYSNTKNSVGFFSIKEQDDWELVNDKFDITTLKPFDSKVLVRHGDNAIWNPAFWGFYGQYEYFKFHTTRGCYVQCIPYEGNEHLLGTTEDCNEYFKIW